MIPPLIPMRVRGLGVYECFDGCDGALCRAATMRRGGYFAVLYSFGPITLGKN